MAGVRFRMSDLPNCRLSAIASPMAGAFLAHGVPAGLMPPVVIATADHKARLVPDDLRTNVETCCFQAVGHFAGMQSAVPNVSDVAGKERPCFAPVRPVIVHDLPCRGALAIQAESLP